MHPGESIAPRARVARSLRSVSDRYATLLIAGVAASAALAARLAWPFDGLYGQDAFAYVRYARALWPWLLRGEPLPIYYWPAGYPLLVALALPLLGGEAAAGQAVSVASVAAAAACTFLLSRELLPDAPGGRLAAWVAGLAVALSGDALRAGLVAMSDALAIASCAAAIWALARYGRTRHGRWLAAAAVALGWAAITRWVCGLLALPMLGFLIADCRLQIADCRSLNSRSVTKPRTENREPRTEHRLTASGSRFSVLLRLNAHWPDFLVAFVLGAAIVIPQLLASQATPEALSQHQWLVGWDIANAWRRDFVTVDGAQHYALPVGMYYLAHMAWPSFLFPALALLCLPGALWLARRRQWAALALLAGWPLLLWLFLSGIPYENARFVLPALPALAALAGLGFGWVYERTTDDRRPTNDQRPTTNDQRRLAADPSMPLTAGNRHFDAAVPERDEGQGGRPATGDGSDRPTFRVRPRSPVSYFRARGMRGWARIVLVVALAMSLAGGLGWGLRGYRSLVVYKNEQLALVEWARARLPAGGVLITFGATLTLQHYTDYDVRELFYLAPPDLDTLAQQGRPVYLLLDVGNIESQWAGLRPWQDYRYLQQQQGLEIVGQRAPYTLFVVKLHRILYKHVSPVRADWSTCGSAAFYPSQILAPIWYNSACFNHDGAHTVAAH